MLVDLRLDPTANKVKRTQQGVLCDARVSHQIPASYRIGYVDRCFDRIGL